MLPVHGNCPARLQLGERPGVMQVDSERSCTQVEQFSHIKLNGSSENTLHIAGHLVPAWLGNARDGEVWKIKTEYRFKAALHGNLKENLNWDLDLQFHGQQHSKLSRGPSAEVPATARQRRLEHPTNSWRIVCLSLRNADMMSSAWYFCCSHSLSDDHRACLARSSWQW